MFVKALLVCSAMGLIGREMFAVDGVKLPSNASKEGSGLQADFARKKARLEEALRRIMAKQREADGKAGDPETRSREKHYEAKLEKEVQKIHAGLAESQDSRSGPWQRLRAALPTMAAPR